MTAPLTPDAIAAWRARAETAIAGLAAGFGDRFCYPPGVNAVHPATPASRTAAQALGPLPAGLAALYREIAATDLPDAGHGFFVHSPDLVAAHGPDPLVFASDGGGLLYALTADGRVLRSLAASRDAWFTPEADCLHSTPEADSLHSTLEADSLHSTPEADCLHSTLEADSLRDFLAELAGRPEALTDIVSVPPEDGHQPAPGRARVERPQGVEVAQQVERRVAPEVEAEQ